MQDHYAKFYHSAFLSVPVFKDLESTLRDLSLIPLTILSLQDQPGAQDLGIRWRRLRSFPVLNLRTGYSQNNYAADKDFTHTEDLIFCDAHGITYIKEIIREQGKGMTRLTDLFIIPFQPVFSR